MRSYAVFLTNMIQIVDLSLGVIVPLQFWVLGFGTNSHEKSNSPHRCPLLKQASRELSRLEREQRAQRYYEQQLQERKKKLLEQRLKEERRRAAVEEKRRQRLRVEKERYESAVRRTLEKSQRVQQQLSQNSRGRKPAKNAHTFTPINTLVPRRLPLTTWEKNLVSRLLAPTCSYLARSKSAACQSPRRSISRHSRPLQLELPSVPEEDAAACGSTFSAGNTRPVRGSGKGQPEKQRQGDPPETPCSNPSDSQPEALSRTALGGSKPQKSLKHRAFLLLPHSAAQAPEVVTQPSSGTSDPEEASRLLAEKRKVARLKREKEEQERPQRAQERAQQEAEAQRLVEEKRRREEEEQRRAEEERAQAIKEAALLQKQVSQMCSFYCQRSETLQHRKTRRNAKQEKRSKPALARILPSQSQPKENTVPAVQNGTIEDAVKLPVGAKSSQLGFSNEEDVVPVVAFRERRSLRALSGLEEIQTQQRAEVI
uniref:Microtubule associated protein 7 n=1 Tax=Nothobranchius furzeri TaxID=105023 RepID=A0A8C6NYT2_NOTFU